jgi:hypothetical protein
LTPSKFLFSKYLSVLEFSEQLEWLLKSKVWYEHHKGIKPSSLSESTLSEYKVLFIKFWIRQIAFFNQPPAINGIDYNHNMYDLDILYEELLENIIFVQCKLLEAYWTINTVNKLIPLKGGIEALKYPEEIIDFYNELYELFKIEILNKFKDIYALRRDFQIERATPFNYEQILAHCNQINNYNEHMNFSSKLNIDNFYKTKIPLNNNKTKPLLKNLKKKCYAEKSLK